MRTEDKHIMYQNYLLLADRGGMTGAQGVQLLKTVFPQFAGTIDEIIEKGGDPDKLKANMERVSAIFAAEDTGNAELNRSIRDGARRSRDGRFAAEDQGGGDDDDSTEGQAGSIDGQREGEAEATPGQGESRAEGGMNTLLRRSASRGVAVEAGEDFNTAMRRAAGRNAS